MNENWNTCIELLKTFVKPALGCTEPIVAAYGAALAKKLLPENSELTQLTVKVSDNLYKNAMGVFVPGTGKIGLAIAAAVGFVAGDPELGLQVLSKITADEVNKAELLEQQNKIIIEQVPTTEFIFCHVIAKTKNDTAEIIIAKDHTNIIEKRLNGNVLFQAKAEVNKQEETQPEKQYQLSLKDVYDFAVNAPFEQIAFILEADKLNKTLSDEGMRTAYGLEIGRTLQENIKQGLVGDDLCNRIVMQSSSASDARMGGASYPAMSNYGSGNQGIVATLPISLYAREIHASDEQLARALIMSHLAAIYIKLFYPPLSAFCGTTATAAATSMALVYLAGGTETQSYYAIMNALSDSSGMVCDGAKATCAMKVGTAVMVGMKAMMLAKNNKVVQNQGIIANDVEQTIKNIGEMVSQGMPETDKTIINIMCQH